jgi:hypothetical protein
MLWNMDAEYAVKLGRKNLDQRLIGPRGVRLWDPDARAEDEELAEIDLLRPNGLTFARLLAEDGRVAPSPYPMGNTRAQCSLASGRARHKVSMMGCGAPYPHGSGSASGQASPRPRPLPTQPTKRRHRSQLEASLSFLALQPVRKLVFEGSSKRQSSSQALSIPGDHVLRRYLDTPDILNHRFVIGSERQYPDLRGRSRAPDHPADPNHTLDQPQRKHVALSRAIPVSLLHVRPN